MVVIWSKSNEKMESEDNSDVLFDCHCEETTRTSGFRWKFTDDCLTLLSQRQTPYPVPRCASQREIAFGMSSDVSQWDTARQTDRKPIG
jgi:hypothetical protein